MIATLLVTIPMLLASVAADATVLTGNDDFFFFFSFVEARKVLKLTRFVCRCNLFASAHWQLVHQVLCTMV